VRFVGRAVGETGADEVGDLLRQLLGCQDAPAQFSIPGIGREFLRSILGRDYPLIMAVYLLYAFLICVANLSVDLVYGMLDPRIKVGR